MDQNKDWAPPPPYIGPPDLFDPNYGVERLCLLGFSPLRANFISSDSILSSLMPLGQNKDALEKVFHS